MKIDNLLPSIQPEVVVGTQDSMSFSIDDDNPVIFSILRDKMYTDKIGSICREVASNSRDANREAGRADIPIEIEISDDDPLLQTSTISIIFRDFGTGITPDRMANVFVKYAASTKRSNNSQTGGFGLGAKTPFAYTDSFIVSTKCFVEGVKMHYIYNAIIDGSGKGKMILLSEEQTSDNTGTEIIIPIESVSDRIAFEEKCYFYTNLWENVTYKGFDTGVPKIKTVYEVEDFKVIKNNTYLFDNSIYYGIIDGIPYPVNPDCFKLGMGNNYVIIFNLPLEKVNISASRESVQEEKVTLEFYRERLTVLSKYLQTEADTFLTVHKDLRDAHIKSFYLAQRGISEEKKALFPPVFNFLRRASQWSDYLTSNNEVVTYKGETIKKDFGLKYHKIYRLSPKDPVYNDDRQIIGGRVSKNLAGATLAFTLNLRFFYNSKSISTKKCITIFNENILNNHYKDFIIIVPDKNIDQKVLDEDMKWLKGTGLNLEEFSKVNAAKTSPSVKNNELVKGIPVREFFYPTSPRKLQRCKEGLYMGGREMLPSNTCIVLVNSVQDASICYDKYKDMKRVVELFFKEDFYCLFVNIKAYEKHLKPLGFNSLKEVYDTIPVQEIEELRTWKEAQSIYKSIPEAIIKEKMFEVLPQSFKKLEKLAKVEIPFEFYQVRKINFDSLKIAKALFNFRGFEKRMEEIQKYKFPLFESFLNDNVYGWRYGRSGIETSRNIRNLKKYIKMVCDTW